MENKTQPRIVRLNNDYTNQEINRQIHKSRPKLRYLGLILLTVVIVLTIPAYGLIASFHSLQTSVLKNTQTIEDSKNLKSEAASKEDMIGDMKNQYYIEKYARAQYQYGKDGEKIFTIPSSDTEKSSSSDVVGVE